MGVGESQGSSAAYDAAKTAIESPLLDSLSIDGAMGILVHFHIHPDYPLAEISEAMDIVEENADEDANIIFGQQLVRIYLLMRLNLQLSLQVLKTLQILRLVQEELKIVSLNHLHILTTMNTTCNSHLNIHTIRNLRGG